MARKIDGMVQVTFYMVPKDHKELKQAAATARRTMGEFIVETVKQRVQLVLDKHAVIRSVKAKQRLRQTKT